MNHTGQHGGICGFTLLETLIVILISSVLMAVVMTSVIQYVNSSAQQSALDDMNAEVSLLFKVIESDVMMAGYGLPPRTRIASDFNCDLGSQVCSNVTGTSTARQSDMLFVADGWQILKSITDTGEDDGHVVPSYMTLVSSKRGSSAGGYSTLLQTDSGTGTNSITLQTLNINSGENFNAPATFLAGNAVIIGTNTKVEGHTIATITSPGTVNFNANDKMFRNYSAAVNHSVVPAHVWSVRIDPDGKKFSDGTTVNWLYRDNYKVLPYVTNFEVQYGYDINNDGLQWSYTVPPTNVHKYNDTYDYTWLGAASAPGSTALAAVDGISYDFSSLKVIQISLTVKSVYKSVVRLQPYQTTIMLRN